MGILLYSGGSDKQATGDNGLAGGVVIQCTSAALASSSAIETICQVVMICTINDTGGYPKLLSCIPLCVTFCQHLVNPSNLNLNLSQFAINRLRRIVKGGWVNGTKTSQQRGVPGSIPDSTFDIFIMN